MSVMTPLHVRAERFGAWVRVDDRTLVALDRDAAREIGFDGGERWSAPSPPDIHGLPSAPLELHVAITSRCPATCGGCYLDAQADGVHVEEESVERTLSQAAAAGVFTVAFGGGEPLTHPALARFAGRARAHGLTPVFTTSGIGLTAQKAAALTEFAQVNVSYDGIGEAYEAVRGFDGAATAERAIELLVAAGVTVGINLVMTRDSFGAGGESVERACARAASLGAREVQLLRYKPKGRAASLDYLTRRLTPEQVEALPAMIRRITSAALLSVRIDCAMVPLLSPAFDDVRALAALGVMGCEAGSALAAVNVQGTISPCSFAQPTEHRADSIGRLWRSTDDPQIAPFRAYADAPPEPCASCPIRSVCRGGCKIVAGHLGSTPFAPDPECPRVRAFRAAG